MKNSYELNEVKISCIIEILKNLLNEIKNKKMKKKRIFFFIVRWDITRMKQFFIIYKIFLKFIHPSIFWKIRIIYYMFVDYIYYYYIFLIYYCCRFFFVFF